MKPFRKAGKLSFVFKIKIGHYSIGAGFVFDKFESYDSMEPAIFEKGSWLMLDDFIRSGNGDTGTHF